MKTKHPLKRAIFAAVVTITLIVLFYTILSFWGRNEWVKTQAELRAKGETLDFTQLIPPAVPDKDNFFATPLWQELLDPENKKPRLGKFKEALGGENSFALLRRDRLLDAFSSPLDLDAISKFYRERELAPQDQPSSNSAQSILVAMSGANDVLSDLQENRLRPESKFPIAYEETFSMKLPHISHLMTVARFLQLHLAAEAALGRGDLAEKDVSLILRLAETLEKEPVLIMQLVRCSILQTGAASIREGIFHQCWTPEQLEQFEALLGKIDIIPDLANALRGERAMAVQTMEPFTHDPDMSYYANLLHGFSNLEDVPPLSLYSVTMGYRFYPKGLIFDDLANYSRIMQYAIEATSDDNVSPAVMDTVIRDNSAKSLPGTRLFTPVISSGIVGSKFKFLETTARIREAIIACCLERHRLAEGSYPDTLLSFSDLPLDPANGEPFKYQKLPDGGYRLWSVGGDGKDDHGKPVYAQNRCGDWVWTMPKDRK